MKKLLLYGALSAITAFISPQLFCQYILNGSATQNNCNCYTLTPAVNTQSGSVWNSNKIDLTHSFDFHFNVFLGCTDANGADGIVFILQPISTSIGSTGEGMGFQGISPSIGITLDTWQNTNLNDPPYDHISIQSNGYINHDGTANNLTPAVQASATSDNIEDCQWHVLRITWDASTHWLRAYFDGDMRAETQTDMVATIFNNDPNVFWGFSGATGGANNLQQFCTALNPLFSVNISASNATCLGTPMVFEDHSESFTVILSYYWDFGDGTTSTAQNPPPHIYPAPGDYEVKHVITGMDGCVSDTMRRTIHVGAIPVSGFTVYDTCINKPPRIVDQSTSSFGNIAYWMWWLDGVPVSNQQQPVLQNLAAGPHQLQLQVTTEYGCVSGIASQSFVVKAAPTVSAVIPSGYCANMPVPFTSTQMDNATFITQWNWSFGDGNTSVLQNPTHTYTTPDNYTVHFSATASNGCASDTTTAVIGIVPVPVAAFAIRDTCEGSRPYIDNQTTLSAGNIDAWEWTVNGQPVSNAMTPDLTTLSPGNYVIGLTAINNSCPSNVATQNLTIKPRPSVAGVAIGGAGCANQPVQFNGTQSGNVMNITQWNWSFGDGQTSTQQNPLHTYTSGNMYDIQLTATADNGCRSLLNIFRVPVEDLRVNAGNDTIIIKDTPFQLQASASSSVSGPINYVWTPAYGLNDPTILRPTTILQDDTTYTLTVRSQGCEASDKVKLTVFKGSAIYVPSGFTPNNDGLNDVLRPRYIGIRKLDYFIIYNRWGEKIFYTTDLARGWDGTISGKPQGNGTFVWIISAVDFGGRAYHIKGTTTIIR